MKAIPASGPGPALTSCLRLTANDHIWWTTKPGKRHQQSSASRPVTLKPVHLGYVHNPVKLFWLLTLITHWKCTEWKKLGNNDWLINKTVKIHNVIQNKQFMYITFYYKCLQGLVIAVVTLTIRSLFNNDQTITNSNIHFHFWPPFCNRNATAS